VTSGRALTWDDYAPRVVHVDERNRAAQPV
jgi:hypothetical protein